MTVPMCNHMETRRAQVCLANWDDALLRSRTMMLGAYFSVDAAGGFPECLRMLRKNRYDLLVLCYTLDDHQQQALATAARETCSSISVLVLRTGQSSDKPFADYLFEISRGPGQLVAQCAGILGCTIKREGCRVSAGTDSI